MLVPIDPSKGDTEGKAAILWYVFLLALGYSKPLCELSSALTVLISQEKTQQLLTLKPCGMGTGYSCKGRQG